MAFSKIYYHVVWTTKYRAPVILDDIETQLYQYIKKKVFQLGGYLHAINGVSDHVHLVVTIPVTISISRFIGQIKAVASTRINKTHFEIGQFKWQSGYSIFSIGQKELPYIIKYVNNQKTHHAEQTTLSNLEILS
jgi:REP element-mobilizing transposase RayT